MVALVITRWSVPPVVPLEHRTHAPLGVDASAQHPLVRVTRAELQHRVQSPGRPPPAGAPCISQHAPPFRLTDGFTRYRELTRAAGGHRAAACPASMAPAPEPDPRTAAIRASRMRGTSSNGTAAALDGASASHAASSASAVASSTTRAIPAGVRHSTRHREQDGQVPHDAGTSKIPCSGASGYRRRSAPAD